MALGHTDISIALIRRSMVSAPAVYGLLLIAYFGEMEG